MGFSSPLKLALFLPCLQQGGAERIILSLATHLDKNQFTTTIVLLSKTGDFVSLLPANLPIVDLQLGVVPKNTIQNIDWIRKLSLKLDEISPDIVLSTIGHANLLALLARKISREKYKVVIRETGILSKYLPEHGSSWYKKLIYRCLYPQADKIIVSGSSMGEDLQKYLNLNKEKLAIIPNFIDPESLLKQSGESIHYPHGVTVPPKNTPIITSLGRLSPEKGIADALYAMQIVLKTHSCRYQIIGAGKELKSLQELAKQLGIATAVDFLGFQSNPYPFIKGSTIFLLPSHHEGFPNSLLEAMALGIAPIITCFNDSAKEFVSPFDKEIMVKPKDHPGMANALLRLLDDVPLRSTIKEHVLQQSQRYTIKKVLLQYEELLLEGVSK